MAKSTSPSSKAVAQVIDPNGMTAGLEIYCSIEQESEHDKLYLKFYTIRCSALRSDTYIFSFSCVNALDKIYDNIILL